jgi:hypothetical protein
MENKVIEWTLDDVFGELRRISLVSTPAIEEEFLLFNGVEMFKTVDDEKRVVTGAAMRPNINIPRKDEEGNLYYGFFSEDTVRRAAELFFKKGSNTNLTNLEHEFEIDGVYVYESWIVEDSNIDKSKVLGFSDVRKGDWFVSMKVENDLVWDNYLKTGLIRGFSVEAKLSESEVNILSRISDLLESDMSIEEQWDRLSKLLK